MQTDADPAAEAQRVQEALCPRCGYDVSGEVETWKDACPLIGRCSECGARFRWLHALRPDWCDADPRVGKWSFEQGERVSVWRFVLTSLRLLMPEHFFGGVCKHHTRRFRRVAALLAVWAGVYGMTLSGPIVAARLFPHPEIYGIRFNASIAGWLFLEALPVWLVFLLVPVVWMVAQIVMGVAMARKPRIPPVGAGDAFRVAAYGVCGVLMLSTSIALVIWWSIFLELVYTWAPIVWIGVVVGAVWSIVNLVQWWPLALANFFHCRRGGTLRWLPTLVGAAAGAVVGVVIVLLWA